MKKYIVLLLLVSVLFITGCGAKKEGIVGKWKTDFASSTYTYTFNEDGTCSYEYGSTKMECTYKTKGEKLSILYKGNTASFDTTYSIKDDELNVKDSFGKDTIYKRIK